MKPRPAAYEVPALEKGLDVLELLSRQRSPMSLAQIASALKRTRNELFRMLNCLEHRGYLVREAGSGAYSLSLRLFEMAHTHSPIERLIKAAGAPMRELSQRLVESCHLSVIREGELLVVLQADSPAPVRVSVEVGSRFPLAKTVSGRLLLAQLPEDELRRTTRDSRSLLAQLGKIRRHGFSEAADETFVGLHDLAVPVGHPSLGFCAALAVTLVSSRPCRSCPRAPPRGTEPLPRGDSSGPWD